MPGGKNDGGLYDGCGDRSRSRCRYGGNRNFTAGRWSVLNIGHLMMGTVGSFLAIACFAVLLECPKKYLPYAGLNRRRWRRRLSGQYGTGYRSGDRILFVGFGDRIFVAYFCQGTACTGHHFFDSGILPTVPGQACTGSFIMLWRAKTARAPITLFRPWRLRG